MNARRTRPARGVGALRVEAGESTISFSPFSAARYLGLSLATASMSARTLFPSEDAVEGSGITFLLVELVALLLLFLGTLERTVIQSVWSWVTACWLFFLAWIWFGSFFASYAFPAKMLAWEWTAVGGLYLAIRRESFRIGPRPFALALIVVGLTQSLYAGWQVTVEYPRLRQLYERRDPEFLEQMRGIGVTPGTVEEARFRDRLYSSEPYGGFGHPNSLAGLLVLTLPLVLAFVFLPLRGGPVAGMGGLLALVVIAAALVITKSRSAWIGTFLSLALWSAISWSEGRRLRRLVWIWGGTVTLLGCLVAAFFAAGILDRLVLSESFKSLQYRLEWWEGSVGVLREHPWRGVGFGNFASRYLAFKLPFSSEEIQDPHNFLLELACCAGIPAMVGYLGILVASLLELMAGSKGAEEETLIASAKIVRGAHSWWWIGTGMAGGLVYLLQPAGALGPMGLGIGLALLSLVAVVAAPDTWRLDQRLRRAIGCGVVGLHVHWLASGGVSFPALALPCWILLASGHDGTKAKSFPAGGLRSPTFGGLGSVVLVILLAAGLAVFVNSLYLPAQKRDQILASVRNYEEEEVGAVLDHAAQVFPDDQTGWNRLADWQLRRMARFGAVGKREEASRAYAAAEDALTRAIALEPNRSANHRKLGELYAEAARHGLDPGAGGKSVQAFGRAVDLYPNSAVRRWEYGVALDRVGEKQDARVQFRRALELDETPHPDKKLSSEQRRAALRVVE